MNATQSSLASPAQGRLRKRSRFATLLLGALALVAPIRTAPALQFGDAAEAKTSTREASSYRLSDLRLFNSIVLLIHDRYVDNERIRAKSMLLSALDYVEKRVPEVLVQEPKASDADAVTITVGTATRSFKIGGVKDLWQMSVSMKEIFRFVEDHLVTTDDQHQLEYAAINGLLATLDPHSNLLDPEQYADMKMQTTGEFGGLGFVVSMRDGRLTIMKVLPRTPAHRGGIRPRDAITRIEDESTVNMDLTEAVKRLRGPPGTPVSFWVDRKGLRKPKKFTLSRARISIDSIDPVKLVGERIGYIRVTNFQGNTTRDLRAALLSLGEKAGGRLKGLVLDLRGNPGGLLDQAIQVTDLFVSDGTIVSTVGMSNKLRERKYATRPGTLSDLPMVVLVSNSSASASEIVSGALKNLNRAIVVGGQTFGKGSVQVLYPQADDSALKLTVAEYLTPGDISIQDVGVTPDIEVEPTLVSRKRLFVFAPRESMRETELEAHMSQEVSGAAPGALPVGFHTEEDQSTDKPTYHLTYLRDDVPEGEEMDEFQEPEWKEDFLVRFARELLEKQGASTRAGMVEKAASVVAERQKKEQSKLEAAIGHLGVNWSARKAATRAGAPTVSARLKSKGVNRGGETVHLVLTVKNEGKTALHRVRAWSDSRSALYVPYSRLFDHLEFALGRIEPGRSQSWSVPVELPLDLPARHEAIDLKIMSDDFEQAATATSELELLPKAQPAFAFSWGIDDGKGLAADGTLNVGETATVWVAVKNVGKGAAKEVIATLKNLDDEEVYIHEGRHRIGPLKSGASGIATMRVELKEGFEKKLAKMRVTIFDAKASEYVSSEIAVPVTAPLKALRKLSGSVRLSTKSVVRAWPALDAPVIASLKKGALLPSTHQAAGFVRVALRGGVVGFVAADETRHLKMRRKAASGTTLRFPIEAPHIELVGVNASPATEEATFSIAGVAEDPSGLRDLYLFLNNQKVYFKAAEDPETTKIPFSTSLKLAEGTNTLLLFARENDSLVGRRSVSIYRRPETLAAAPMTSIQK